MKWLRYTVIAVNALAALALLAIGVGAWLVSSDAGSARIVHWLVGRAAPYVQIGATSGTLTDVLTLHDVVLVVGDDRAEIEWVGLSPDLGQLLRRAVVIDRLSAGPARVTYTPGPARAAGRALDLPVAVIVRDAALAGIEVVRPGATHRVGATRLAGSLIGSDLEIAALESDIDDVRLAGRGRVGLAAGVALGVTLDWSLQRAGRTWTGRGTVTGTWPALVVEHALTTPLAVTTAGTVTLGGPPVVDLEIGWTDLAWPGIAIASSPSGALTLTGPLDALRYRAAGELVTRGVALDFDAEGSMSPERVVLAPLELGAGPSSLIATGEIAIDARRWAAEVRGEALDPSLFLAGWPGRIGAVGRLSGTLEREPVVAFEDLALAGSLRDYPFDAVVAGAYRAPGRWSFERGEVVSGPDRVRLSGTIDEAVDLELEAHTEQLGLLWPGFDGVLDARVALTGRPAEPRAKGSVEASRLTYRQNRLERATLTGEASLAPGGAVDVAFVGDGLTLGNVAAETLDGRVRGTLESHEIDLDVDGPEWRTALSAHGGIEQGAWQGELGRWAVEQTEVGLWQSSGATQLRLSPGDYRVDRLCLTRLEAELCATLQLAGTAADRLEARARDFELGMLAPFLPPGLSLDGRYGLEARFTDLSGEPSGTLRLTGGTTRVEFAASDRDRVDTVIDNVMLDAEVVRRRLALDLTLDGRDTGRMDLEAVVADLRNRASPIEGRLEANWSDLAVLSLLSPEVGAVGGALQVVLDIAGTRATPALQGRAAWREGRVELPVWGVAVDRIDASATSADGQALEFVASGFVEDAELRVAGSSRLDRDAGWPTELRLSGESVPIVQLPDADIFVSPDLDVRVTLPEVSVVGTVRVPRARLALEQLPEQAVRPSIDTVVHGREEPEPVRPLAVNADIRVVLGSEVTYTGSNLDTTLSGDLRLLYASGRTANASGSLSIDGSYDAYGQSLDLDRGELVFTGPLDDPTLDVRAVRSIGEVTVGVQLAGTLKAPQTRMFSDPSMSEADALSYLLLGRPLAGSGQDSAIVQSAALSMGLQQALPVVQRIGETLGLDEFSIEANDVDTGALMAGKYLSPKIYIRYSYGLFNRIGGLLLRFKINDRLSIETRSGDQKSMDVLYTVEKD